MLKRILFSLSLLLVVSIGAYSQIERGLPFSQEILLNHPPMRGLVFNPSATLNGRVFLMNEYALSFREQSARIAFPSGITHTYWLYDTYTYHNGNKTVIRNQIVPQWLESLGYTVDYEKIRTEESDDEYITQAVKTVMAQRECDVAITVYLRTIRQWGMWGGRDVTSRDFVYIGFVIINEYHQTTGRYTYTYIPTTVMNIGR